MESYMTEIKKDGYMSESKAVALRLVENDWDREFSYKLACPVCWSPENKGGSSEYVHIEEPEYRAWETTSANEPLYTRGDQVRIPMTTECCERRFVLVIGHHKGQTLIGALLQ
jgi:hypothetical protein